MLSWQAATRSRFSPSSRAGMPGRKDVIELTWLSRLASRTCEQSSRREPGRRARRRRRQGRDRILNLRGADYVTTRRLLDRDEALRRLETRLGPLHEQLRLGMEREHEAQAFGQGLSFLHLENLPLMQAMIEIALRVTGTYWRGRANAGNVQVRRNIVRLPNLPSAFDGFTILHLSDLHADLSGPAMQRAAELAHGLDYDLCALTGDYRGRTHGDCGPCLEGVPSRWGCCHPHPSQSRTCGFPASGSSRESFARVGVEDAIRDSPVEKRTEVMMSPPSSSPVRLSVVVSWTGSRSPRSPPVFPGNGSHPAAPPFPRAGPGEPSSPRSAVL